MKEINSCKFAEAVMLYYLFAHTKQKYCWRPAVAEAIKVARISAVPSRGFLMLQFYYSQASGTSIVPSAHTVATFHSPRENAPDEKRRTPSLFLCFPKHAGSKEHKSLWSFPSRLFSPKNCHQNCMFVVIWESLQKHVTRWRAHSSRFQTRISNYCIANFCVN